MQKIVREHNGFRSVAKESDFIWRKYCHPRLHSWRYEGCPPERIDDRTIDYVHARFRRYTLSAKAWRRAKRLDVQRYQRSPLLAPFLRAGYFVFAAASQPVSELLPLASGSNDDWRLVDKSVNSALFLNLLDRVFPDAKYVHIVREGNATIRSMVESWLNPDRFFTYIVPGGLQIPDYPHKGWNFALPAGWEDYRSKPLADVVTFQWTQLQQAILSHFDEPDGGARLLRVKLEDLVNDRCSVLRRLADFIEVPWSDYFERLSRGMPSVNARPLERTNDDSRGLDERMVRLNDCESERLRATNSALGYPV
jgi:hypothetical protein